MLPNYGFRVILYTPHKAAVMCHSIDGANIANPRLTRQHEGSVRLKCQQQKEKGPHPEARAPRAPKSLPEKKTNN